MRGPWGNGGHLGSRGSRGTRPARREKGQTVGIRQWRRVVIAKCIRTQETGSSQHQATFMHRVRIIVCCVLVTVSITITGIMFYCIICLRRINHLVVNTICIHPLVYEKLCRAQLNSFIDQESPTIPPATRELCLTHVQKYFFFVRLGLKR